MNARRQSILVEHGSLILVLYAYFIEVLSGISYFLLFLFVPYFCSSVF